MPTISIDPPSVYLPAAGAGLEQDEEWCEILGSDGSGRRIRFHDYEDIFAIPGLYEHLFAERLCCDSPQVVSAALHSALLAEGADPAQALVLDFGAGNGMVGEQLRGLGVKRLVGVDLLTAARNAAARDRPGVYDDYLAADLTDLSRTQLERLSRRRSQR